MRFPSVVATEFMKLRRSKVTWMTFAAYAFMAAMAGFFMWMTKNPGMARNLGLIGQKANFAFGGGATDWPAFLPFIVEMGAIGGLIMSSVIVAFVFGREYTEGMAKNMLALPIPRSWFVLGKLVVSAAWFALLTLWLIAASYLRAHGLGTVRALDDRRPVLRRRRAGDHPWLGELCRHRHDIPHRPRSHHPSRGVRRQRAVAALTFCLLVLELLLFKCELEGHAGKLQVQIQRRVARFPEFGNNYPVVLSAGSDI